MRFLAALLGLALSIAEFGDGFRKPPVRAAMISEVRDKENVMDSYAVMHVMVMGVIGIVNHVWSLMALLQAMRGLTGVEGPLAEHAAPILLLFGLAAVHAVVIVASAAIRSVLFVAQGSARALPAGQSGWTHQRGSIHLTSAALAARLLGRVMSGLTATADLPRRQRGARWTAQFGGDRRRLGRLSTPLTVPTLAREPRGVGHKFVGDSRRLGATAWRRAAVRVRGPLFEPMPTHARQGMPTFSPRRWKTIAGASSGNVR